MMPVIHAHIQGNLRYEECQIYKEADKETQEFYKVVRCVNRIECQLVRPNMTCACVDKRVSSPQGLTTDLFSLLLHTRKDSTTRDSFTRLSEKKRR